MRALEETLLFPAERAWWLWLATCEQVEKGSGVALVLGDSSGGLFTLYLCLFLSPDSLSTEKYPDTSPRKSV